MTDPSMTRKSNGLDLTPETQAEILQIAKYKSAFMQLVPEMKLPRQRCSRADHHRRPGGRMGQ